MLFVEQDLESTLVVSHKSDLGAKVSLLAQLTSCIGQYLVPDRIVALFGAAFWHNAA